MRGRNRAEDLPDVFLGREVVEGGLLTEKQLRGPTVKRVLRGVYRPSWVHETHELRCAAAGLVIPASAVITGRSTATLLGVPLARVGDDVEVAVPEEDHFDPPAGVMVRRAANGVGPGTPWRTTGLAGPFRFGFDLAARRPLPLGTAYLDAVARAGHLPLEEFRKRLDDCHDNDVCAVRAAAELVDPRAESIPESQVRVLLRLAGFPVEPQHVITVGNNFVARVDLALVDQRIAIEYDGAWHALREQLEKDRRRLNTLHAAGWVVVHVTAEMLRDPAQLVEAVRRAVAIRVR
jgi:very-short-patch-repair endonuclease